MSKAKKSLTETLMVEPIVDFCSLLSAVVCISGIFLLVTIFFIIPILIIVFA